MRAKIYWTILILIWLSSCGKTTKTEQSEFEVTDSAKKEIKTTATPVADTTKTTAKNDTGCTRGQAEPVTRKTIYSNATFKLNEDNLTGTETVGLKNGDRLTIKNWGCESYALTFRFETERFHSDTTDINYWIDKGLLLMKEIKNGLDAPLNIEGGEAAIKDYLKENKEYKLGDWVDYGNKTIPTTLTIDRIQKLNDKRFAIELTYSVGPL